MAVHQDSTRERIVEIVEALMMERGFNAISYQDVAARIGIRKASIHYHFPAKADLGAAVIAQYVAKLEAATIPMEAVRAAGFASAFESFLAMFAMVAASPRKVCLGAVLGAEFETLPEAMQAQVRRFYEHAQAWLGDVLEEGRKDGVFAFAGDSEDAARAIVSAMEGALIIGRALGEPAQLAAAAAAARKLAGLKEPQPRPPAAQGAGGTG